MKVSEVIKESTVIEYDNNVERFKVEEILRDNYIHGGSGFSNHSGGCVVVSTAGPHYYIVGYMSDMFRRITASDFITANT